MPSPVIVTGRPVARPIIRGATAKVSVPRTASSPSTDRPHLPLADRPAHGLDLAQEVERVARPHDPLEPDVVDAGEEHEPALVLGLREDGDGAALSEGLDHLHAGMIGLPGKWPAQSSSVTSFRADDALARDELDHLVDEEERRAVRDDRLDLRPCPSGAPSCREPVPQRRAAAVGVALRRADRKPGGVGDLGEADVEGVLQRDDRRLGRRQLGEAAAELAARLGRGERLDRVAVARRPLVGDRAAPSGAPRAPGRSPCTC